MLCQTLASFVSSGAKKETKRGWNNNSSFSDLIDARQTTRDWERLASRLVRSKFKLSTRMRRKALKQSILSQKRVDSRNSAFHPFRVNQSVYRQHLWRSALRQVRRTMMIQLSRTNSEHQPHNTHQQNRLIRKTMFPRTGQKINPCRLLKICSIQASNRPLHRLLGSRKTQRKSCPGLKLEQVRVYWSWSQQSVIWWRLSVKNMPFNNRSLTRSPKPLLMRMISQFIWLKKHHFRDWPRRLLTRQKIAPPKWAYFRLQVDVYAKQLTSAINRAGVRKRFTDRLHHRAIDWKNERTWRLWKNRKDINEIVKWLPKSGDESMKHTNASKSTKLHQNRKYQPPIEPIEHDNQFIRVVVKFHNFEMVNLIGTICGSFRIAVVQLLTRRLTRQIRAIWAY